MSAALAPPTAADAGTEPARPAEPRLLMTRAEFEAADACPGTRVEWFGVTGETKDSEPPGLAAAAALSEAAAALPLAEIYKRVFPA